MKPAQRFYVFEATPLSEPRIHTGKHRVCTEMVRATDYDALLAQVQIEPHKLKPRGDHARDRLVAARLNLRQGEHA